MAFTNGEGISDPTAGAAIENVSRWEERQAKQQKRRDALKHRDRVYVVSPFRGDIVYNTQKAIDFSRYVITQGRIPVASHLMYPRIIGEENEGYPDCREMGMCFGLSLLSVCREVWVFTQNGITVGMQEEINEAARLGKKVVYIGEVV